MKPELLAVLYLQGERKGGQIERRTFDAGRNCEDSRTAPLPACCCSSSSAALSAATSLSLAAAADFRWERFDAALVGCCWAASAGVSPVGTFCVESPLVVAGGSCGWVVSAASCAGLLAEGGRAASPSVALFVFDVLAFLEFLVDALGPAAVTPEAAAEATSPLIAVASCTSLSLGRFDPSVVMVEGSERCR